MGAAFGKEGTVTAGNASTISDGAAAIVVAAADKAEKLGVTPQARILGYSTHSQEPEWFTTAPIGAIGKLLACLGWKAADVDLFELNEAFSVVPMAAMKELNIPHAKLNIHGGAVALGHPIGASGARVLVTLLNALALHNGRRGIASLCIGGGEAVALAVERIKSRDAFAGTRFGRARKRVASFGLEGGRWNYEYHRDFYRVAALGGLLART